MKKKIPEIKTQPYKLLLISLIIVVVGGFITLWVQKDTTPKNSIRTPDAQLVEKKFDQMNISLFVTLAFDTEVTPNHISLSNGQGNITISRIATNFDNVKDYFVLLAERNGYDNYTSTPLTINGYDSLLVEITRNDGEKRRIYFIYVDHLVYNISTSDSNLYVEQDLIADSFKYTPLDP